MKRNVVKRSSFSTTHVTLESFMILASLFFSFCSFLSTSDSNRVLDFFWTLLAAGWEVVRSGKGEL